MLEIRSWASHVAPTILFKDGVHSYEYVSGAYVTQPQFDAKSLAA